MIYKGTYKIRKRRLTVKCRKNKKNEKPNKEIASGTSNVETYGGIIGDQLENVD